MNAELADTFFHWYTPQPGDTVLEVGAGAGGETNELAEMVAPGFVLAVEANPTAFALLSVRCADNVSCVHAAALDFQGEAQITDDPLDLLRNKIVTGEHDSVTVAAVTLDALCADVDSVGFLKMNIEGSEARALHGATETLKRTRNVCVSCHDFLGMATKQDVSILLIAAGFTIGVRANAPDSCRADYVYGRR